MKQVGQLVNQVVGSTDSSLTSNTPETRSRTRRFTQDEIDKTSMFFARLVTIYGKSKTKTIWGDSDEQLRVTRREWAKTIGQFSIDQLEQVFDRLKSRLSQNDERYVWPDIPKILALASESEQKAAHRVFPRGLPEPSWRKEQRRTVGRIASQTAVAVVHGKACFVEDKPGGDCEAQ